MPRIEWWSGKTMWRTLPIWVRSVRLPKDQGDTVQWYARIDTTPFTTVLPFVLSAGPFPTQEEAEAGINKVIQLIKE